MIDMEHSDETDLTRDDLLAMWEEGEPVEIVNSPVTMNPSPWLQEASHTSPARHGFTWERHKSNSAALRLSGAASS
jgi:hypothetical protein